MYDCGKGRSCATCIHHTAIGEEIPAACAGCIVGGMCTKWEALRLTSGEQKAA